MVQEAFNYAVDRHRDQHYGDRNYNFHLLNVMACMAELGFTSPSEMAVCALHDVLEDTVHSEGNFNQVLLEIRSQFGEDIARYVLQLTRQKHVPLELYYSRMEDAAFRPKLADRLSNVRNLGNTGGNEEERKLQADKLFPKWRDEQPYLISRAGDSKEMVRAIFKIGDALNHARGRIIHEKYVKELLTDYFGG